MKRLFSILLLLAAAITVAATLYIYNSASRVEQVIPAIDLGRMECADSVICRAIAHREFPGAVLCVVKRANDARSMGDVLYLKAYGDMQLYSSRDTLSGEYRSDVIPMPEDAIFDLASLTKSVGTTLAFMHALEEGRVTLNGKVKEYIPDFKAWDSIAPVEDVKGRRKRVEPKVVERRDITIVQLLTHTSGMPAGVYVPRFMERFAGQELSREALVDSLENYLQEAGRAGRDVHTEADCYVLYNDDDLNKHFILLNQTKLTLSEINQIWRAIKALTKNRKTIYISPLEVARKAGWEEMTDIETKVKSAIYALETAGYVRRGMNSPRIFATSIIPKCFEDAAQRIDAYGEMTEEERVNCKRIVKSLISQKSRALAGTNEAESRVDYLSDMLGIDISRVIQAIESMRNAGILARDNDMTAYLRKKLLNELGYYAKLEQLLLSYIEENGPAIDLKIFNEFAIENGIKKSKIKDIKTLIFFWQIQDYTQKAVRQNDIDKMNLILCDSASKLQERLTTRAEVCRFIISEMEKMENLVKNQQE